MPQWTPSQRELDDLELVTLGAVPVASFAPQVPAEVAAAAAAADGTVEVLDPEGVPLVRLTLATGAVQPLAHPTFGPFRAHVLPPAQVRAAYPDAFVVPLTGPLSTSGLEAVSAHAASTGRTPLLLACTGVGSPRGVSAPGLVRAARAAAGLLPGAAVLATPVTGGAWQPVAGAYADDVLAPPNAESGELPAPVAEVVAQDHPPRHRRGFVLFLTGLSGSGKSTIARAVVDRLLERGDRTVTSLDGDVVRHHLSHGLGFGRADRETNIRRIGWVAAEISRHRGVAICSPIAPFDRTRREVRQLADDAGGGFVLVHVATPLAECERRDRKGLYARARAGEIPDFTGISSPYEEPADAVLRIDTTGRDLDGCVDQVLSTLHAEGWLA